MTGTFETLEKKIILTRLAECGYCITDTAKSLELGIRTVQRKLKRYGYVATRSAIEARASLELFATAELTKLEENRC